MSISQRTIDIFEPSVTLRRVIAKVLKEVGAEVRVRSLSDGIQYTNKPSRSDNDKQLALADLLVVDVEGVDDSVSEVISPYREMQRPVLFLGLRRSRDRVAEQSMWLDRPFSPADLLEACRTALSARIGEVNSAREAPDQQTAITTLADATSEPHLDDASASDSTASIVISVAEDGTLERVVSSTDAPLSISDKKWSGSSSAGLEDVDEDDEGVEITEIDPESSLILDFDDLTNDIVGRGGVRVGDVRVRELDPRKLLSSTAQAIKVEIPRSPSLSMTMPDSPSARGLERDPHSDPQDTLPDKRSVESERQSLKTRLDDPEALRRFATVLAEEWPRIGLTARNEDRAERLLHLLRGYSEESVVGARRVLRRLPAETGLWGSLDVLSVFELLETSRDRQLCGRLEISAGNGEAGVLYVNCGVVDEVDSLTGDSENLLLEILADRGAIEEDTYLLLTKPEETNSPLPPIQVRLRSEFGISDEALRHALRQRACKLLERLHRGQSGSFAFIASGAETSHSWPADGLGIPVEEFKLFVSRLEAFEFETIPSQSFEGRAWVPHYSILTVIPREMMTSVEGDVLDAFHGGQFPDQASKGSGHKLEHFEFTARRLIWSRLLVPVSPTESSLPNRRRAKAGSAPKNRQTPKPAEEPSRLGLDHGQDNTPAVPVEIRRSGRSTQPDPVTRPMPANVNSERRRESKAERRSKRAVGGEVDDPHAKPTVPTVIDRQALIEEASKSESELTSEVSEAKKPKTLSASDDTPFEA